jgi:membrane-bound metal-dependent hydrolase YbcI (DUF457 family)
MPSGKMHVIIAGIFFICILYFLNIKHYLDWTPIIYLPAFLLYTLLPDIDIPNSSIAPEFKKFCVLGVIIGFLANYFKPHTYVLFFTIFCAVMLVATIFTTHRKFFHSPLAAAILAAPLLYIGWKFALSAFLGYCFHLLIDGELFQGGVAS